MIHSYDDLDANIEPHKLKLFKELGIWIRIPSEDGSEVKDKHKELVDVLYAYTHKYNPNLSEEERIQVMSKFEDNMNTDFLPDYTKLTQYYSRDDNLKTCVCSCSRCRDIYFITHTKTQQTFGIGSKCIKKIVDELFIKKVYYARMNGVCEFCKIYKVIKTTPLFEKNCNSKNSTVCFRCKIPFMELQIEQLNTLLQLRNIVLRKNKILLNYEKDFKVIALSIPYDKKDYYCNTYKTYWNPDLKLWFINTSKIRHKELCNKIYLGY